MCTESIQMLFTNIHWMGLWQPGMYKPQQPNHPCTMWARQGQDNFWWLYQHAIALEAEWQKRYGHNKKQRALEVFHEFDGQDTVNWLPPGGTPFANCAAHAGYGLDFKHVFDTRVAYKKYLRARWRIQQEHYGSDEHRTQLPRCSVRF